MIKTGLTGNIGSGKSTVCKIFETIGVPVFYSDIVAKNLYLREDVKEKLFSRFGNEVFDVERNVDFKKLAGKIFSVKEDLNFINKLIHPLVFEEYEKWLSDNKNAPLTIHESAILFENNLQKNFDKTIVVSCPKEIRLKRLLKRDKVPENVILKRMDNQMPDKEKEALSDFVIVNDGNTFLIPQVMNLYSKLVGIKL